MDIPSPLDARGVFFDPARNTGKGAKISQATAVVLASAGGLRVSGFDDENNGRLREVEFPRPEERLTLSGQTRAPRERDRQNDQSSF